MNAGEVLDQINSLIELDGEKFTNADIIGLIADLVNSWEEAE